MSKIKIALLIATLTIATGAETLYAQVTGANLTVRARRVDFPSETLLRLNVRTFLEGTVNKACNIRLFATVTRIGNEEAIPARRLIAIKRIRPALRRNDRASFVYNGRSINGTQNRQWQSNFQARVKCRGEDIIISNAESTNITCAGGVKRGQFIPILRDNIEVN